MSAQPCLGSSGQGSNVFRSKAFITTTTPVSAIDSGEICITGAFNKVFPLGIDLVNNRVVGTVMGINVQNAINFIGLPETTF